MMLQIPLNDAMIAFGIAFISTAVINLLVPNYLSGIKSMTVITTIRFVLILSILNLHTTTQQTDLYLLEISILLGIIALSSADILLLLTHTYRYNADQFQVKPRLIAPQNTKTQASGATKLTEKTADENDHQDIEEVTQLLQNITVDDVESLIDFGEEKQTLGMKVAMAHVLRRVGNPVPNHQTWEEIKAEHKEGVSKEYIGTCKRILKDNGLMKSIPFGTKEKIVWEDPEVIALTVIAKQIGDMDDV